jgi:GT2 family glycosyltransferase
MISFCNVFPHDLALGIFDFDTADFRWVDLSSIHGNEKIAGITGLSFYKNRSMRYWFTTQSENSRSALVTLDKGFNLDKIFRLSETRDAHSLVPFEDGLLITDTQGNRINRIQLGGNDDANFSCESEFWRYSDEQIDKVHVNSVAVVDSEVYVSLFGTKPKEGWRNARSGKIINISKNRLICNNLFHPHSLLNIDGILYWLESGTSKVFRFSETEGREVVMRLTGYLRGITHDDKYIYVASSAARQQSRSTGTLNVPPSNPDDMHSWIYRINREDLKVEKQKLTLFGAEIFDLVLLDDKIQFEVQPATDPTTPVLQRLWKHDQEYLDLKESNIALTSQHDKTTTDLEVLQDINLRNQKTIEEKDNQISQLNDSIKIIDTQLKEAIKDVGILQNINLGHQKTIEEKNIQVNALDAELRQAVKDVEVLQDINLRNQKTIEEKERNISILQSHTTALGNTLALREAELSDIKGSVIFGILRRIAVFVDRMAPPNSSRRDPIRLAKTAIIVRRQYGTGVMLHEAKKKFFGRYKQKAQQVSKSKEDSDNASLFFQLASELERVNNIDQDIWSRDILCPKEKKPVEDEYLREFLAFGSANVSKLREYPLVSIIITTYNNLEDLKKNILSVEAKTTYPNYEIIIVTNNCDADSPTRKYLSSLEIKHKVYVYNDEYSFSEINNFGASKANGELFLFLNDDTEVNEPRWLEALVKLAIYPSTGAVGGKILYPDGTLQDAGGIIWGDGNAWNYGKYNFDAMDPNVNFVRDVDYCSASFLLVKKSVFNELGGFDKRYSPAYYEDADLCFALRDREFNVLYQPLSTIIHKEGGTQGTDTSRGLKAYQPINQKKFFARWKHKFEGRLEASYDNTIVERSRRIGKRILYIDHYVPTPDKDAGSLRTFYTLGILSWLGHNITFWPDNLDKNEPYVTELQQKGVEVIYGPNKFEKFITSRGRNFDIIILSRPHIAAQYIDTILEYAPHSKIIYDTIDLHYLRLCRQALIEKNPELFKEAQKMKETEMKLIKSSNVTFIATKKEGAILKYEDNSVNPVVLPTFHIPRKNILPFEDREHIVFIGGFQHTPNVDAAIFLTNDIFHLIKRHIKNVKLFIVGSNPPDSIKALASEDTIVTGYVPDIAPYFERFKVMIAPIRYGAGIRGKITESMSFGLPVVTTNMGGEGLDMVEGDSILFANSPEEFASKTARIYTDKDLWNKISTNSRELATKRYAPENVLEMFRILFSSEYLALPKRQIV